MILKITDLENYTQFINTQPVNKNIYISVNVMDNQQEQVLQDIQVQDQQAGETQIIGNESSTGPTSGANTAFTGGGGISSLPKDLGIPSYG